MPCYIKSRKRKGLMTTEYNLDGVKYFVGKRIKKPKKTVRRGIYGVDF